MKRISALMVLTLILTACSPIEQNARNTAAALQGAISSAQSKYQTQCTADKTQQVCTVINQAVAGQNALVTAVEGYCGWAQSSPPPNGTAPCVPVKTAAAGLQTAINNANLFIAELKGVLQ